MRKRWWGYGNGNFPLVMREYGPALAPAATPHSGILDSLVTGGYPGACVYLVMIAYLLWIGRRDPRMLFCGLWLVISMFVQANLNAKTLWPILVIGERELQLSRSPGRVGWEVRRPRVAGKAREE